METSRFNKEFYDSIKAKPTLYRGVEYKSMLEAKWAAFFDILDWDHKYEPCVFPGWKPDFVIKGAKNVYVEVKPTEEFDGEVAAKMEGACRNSELLLVGCSPFREDFGIPCLGWMNQFEQDGWSDRFALATMGRWSKGNGKIGFCHQWATYSDRISGGYDGGHYGDLRLEWKEIEELWTQAEVAINE